MFITTMLFLKNLNHWLFWKKWGGSGGIPPQKILRFRCLEMLFSLFSRQYLGLKTIKIMTIVTIFYAYYNHSFPQNLNLWLLENSEMINLQMLIQKNTFNFLSSSSRFEKTCSAMSASVSLVRTPFWNMRKPAWDLVLWKCPRRSTTLRSASIFYTSAERLTRLKLLKCAFI